MIHGVTRGLTDVVDKFLGLSREVCYLYHVRLRLEEPDSGDHELIRRTADEFRKILSGLALFCFALRPNRRTTYYGTVAKDSLRTRLRLEVAATLGNVEACGIWRRSAFKTSDLYSCLAGFLPIMSDAGDRPGNKRCLDRPIIIVFQSSITPLGRYFV